MVEIQNLDSDAQTRKGAPKSVLTARAVARRRRRQQNLRTRDVTREERREMISIRKKKKRIMTGVRPGFATIPPGQQTRSFTFGNYIENVVYEMYLPDKDHRNSLVALASNVNGLMKTTDGKQACIFALGIMCCVNPNFEEEVPERISQIGYNITTVRIPSQAAEYGIDPEPVEMLDIASYLAIFGITLLFVFKTATTQNFNHFLTVRMNALKAAAGVDQNVTVPNPYSLTKAQSVRAVLGSSLYLKKRIINMVISMQNGERNINAVCRYVATTLEYNEMSAVMFPFETLVMTSSIILTDHRVLSEVMCLSEALELMSSSNLPQYFRYLAPPDQAAKLERARFPTLAAVGQMLKQEYMKQESVKNLVGVKGSANALVEELCTKHKKYLMRKKPVTLDMLAKQICQPVGATILGDDEDDEEMDDEEEEEEALDDEEDEEEALDDE